MWDFQRAHPKATNRARPLRTTRQSRSTRVENRPQKDRPRCARRCPLRYGGHHGEHKKEDGTDPDDDGGHLAGECIAIGGSRSILGAFPIFIATVALIGREFIEIQRFYRQCHALLDRHIVCRDLSPDDFTRFAIYCFIGMVQVFLLFYVSAVVDGRKRESEFEGAWRT